MTSIRLSIAVLCALAAVATTAAAADVAVQVRDAWARHAPMLEGAAAKSGPGNGAVYATLVNKGNKADALVSATSDAARAVEVHETYQEAGMVMMRPVEQVVVPGGGQVEMRPGGYHLMLFDLKHELKAGQAIRLVLVFRDAGRIAVTAAVR
jgi:copper(I)-binding protein